MANDGSVIIGTELDEGGFRAGLQGLGDIARKGLSAVGYSVGAAVGATVAFGKASVQTGMQFDAAMSQVAATMGLTVDEIGDLRQYALDMGATTAFSASESAEALNYMALAGYDAETAMSALPNVLNLAAAGNIALASASDMVTDAQSALGLSLDDTSALVDKMARASSRSNTSVAQLGDAILTVGGTARTLAGGTTELTTVLGLLADNGIKGAEGGTALRNVILSLSAPTDKAAKKMRELGLEVFDANGNMRPMEDIFTDLNGILSDMTQGEQTQVLNELFNKVDLKSVNALLNTNVSRWKSLTKEIDNAEGAASDMAAVQLDNLAGDITLFQSALEGAKITLSDELTPEIRNFVQFGTAEIGKLDKAFRTGGITGFASQFGDSLGDAASAILNAAPDIIDAGGTLAGSLMTSVVDNLASDFPNLLRRVLNSIDKIGEGIIAIIPDLMAGIGEVIGGAIVNLPKLLEIGNDLILGITKGVLLGIGGLGEGIINGLSDLISGEIGDQTLEAKQYLDDLKAEFESFQTGTAQDLATALGELDTKASAAEHWIEIFEDLSTKTSLTAEEQGKLNAAVDALNELFPDLGLAIDEETGKWSANSDEIRKNIEIIKQRAKAEIYADKGKKTLERIVELEIERNEVQSKIDEITPLYERHVAELENMTNVSLELGDAMNDINTRGKTFKDINLSDAAIEWAASNGLVIDSYQSLQEASELAQYQYQTQAATLKTTVADEKATLDTYKTTLATIGDQLDTLNAQYDSFYVQAQNATKRAETTGYEQGVAYTAGLKTTANMARSAGAEVLAAAQDGTNDKSGAFRSKGEQGGASYASGVKNGENSARSSGAALLAAAETGASGGSFYSIGYNMGAGVADGLKGATALVERQAGNIASTATSAMQRVALIKSPSRLTRDKVGVPLGQGVAVGLKQSLDDIGDVIDYEISGAIADENRKITQGNVIDAERTATAETSPRYVETNIEIDGRTVAKTTTPYISKEIAWK